MLRKILGLILVLCITLLEAKPPQISPRDVTLKAKEILSAHPNYKIISNLLAERILKNFIDEIDPAKTYFIESDIGQWLYPTDEITQIVVKSFKSADFRLFEKIHNVAVMAIERRDVLEKEMEKRELPQGVDKEELRDVKWVNSKEELIGRLLKIKSLQLDAAQKLEDQVKDQFFQRVKKRRITREAQVLGKNAKERKQIILSYVLKATASSLDSHTNYFTPSEASQFLIQVQQRLFGIGAELRDDLSGFTIVRIIEKGPAGKNKKLKINDRIIAVDKTPVVGMDIVEAVELIRGSKGTKVVLSVLRKDLETNKERKIDIKITRGEVVLEDSRVESSYEPYGDGIIGVIKLHSFYQDPKSSSADDVKQAMNKFKKENNLKGIILDLRNNSGGLLHQAVAVTGLFITKGVVVSVKDGAGRVKPYRTSNSKMSYDGPLIVLTNKTSASAAEIVAQTLQDYGRAFVVGDENTFGKGTFQLPSIGMENEGRVNDKGEYKVTHGKYYTVSGKSPQLVGVRADIIVPGFFSELDIGEKFTKYPLENDSIQERFDDDLSDIPSMHRKHVGLLYKHNMQQKLTLYTQYLDQLKTNSQTRISQNKNYQNFLKDLKNKRYEDDFIEFCGKSDLQLVETQNIMKDMVFLMDISNKQFASY
jgi:carboxyl-terminal processing protease